MSKKREKIKWINFEKSMKGNDDENEDISDADEDDMELYFIQ